MPTYDYVCQACKHRLEIFQSMSESPKKKCPKCGKQKLQRQIGAGAAILFKGSGFYQTDYRSSSYSEGAKKDSAGAQAKPKETAPAGGDAAKTPAAPAAVTQPAAPAPSEKRSKSARKRPG